MENLDVLLASLAWSDNTFIQVFSFVYAAALFAAFHFLTTAKVLEPLLLKRNYSQDKAVLMAGVIRKIAGGITLLVGSILGLLIMSLNPVEYGISGVNLFDTLTATLVLSIIFVPVVGLSMLKPDMWQHYPEIRARDFSGNNLLLSGIAWVVYLIGFEFFFRGFLLFLWVDIYGVWPALAMTTSLYILVHLVTNPPETASTLPMGFVFGLMALLTGGFVAPLILHALIAITSDLVAARANPEIKT